MKTLELDLVKNLEVSQENLDYLRDKEIEVTHLIDKCLFDLQHRFERETIDVITAYNELYYEVVKRKRKIATVLNW